MKKTIICVLILIAVAATGTITGIQLKTRNNNSTAETIKPETEKTETIDKNADYKAELQTQLKGGFEIDDSYTMLKEVLKNNNNSININ